MDNISVAGTADKYNIRKEIQNCRRMEIEKKYKIVEGWKLKRKLYTD